MYVSPIYFIVLLLVLAALFAITRVNIYSKVDEDQYRATRKRVDDLLFETQALRSMLNNGYYRALDQIVTLQLRPSTDGSEESYFEIVDPTTGYCVKAATDNGESLQPSPTKRHVTLRELLNRVLEDIPVELVHPVAADWKFKYEVATPEPAKTRGPWTADAVAGSDALHTVTFTDVLKAYARAFQAEREADQSIHTNQTTRSI